jgi:hypothetical protein
LRLHLDAARRAKRYSVFESSGHSGQATAALRHWW